MDIRRQIRILPMMIMVACMAFSVRLADVYWGVQSLNNTAYAESGAESSSEDKHETKVEEHTAEKEHAKEESEKSHADLPSMDTAAGAASYEKEESKWRDSNEMEASFSPVKMEIMEDIASRRKALDKRSSDLQIREALLQATEQELDKKLQQLNVLRQKIEGLLGQQEEEEQTRFQSLVKVYEGMKAKEAAAIFDTLDLDILVQLMSRMSERKLSPILAKMNPERAKTVTIMLAEQKQLPALPK